MLSSSPVAHIGQIPDVTSSSVLCLEIFLHCSHRRVRAADVCTALHTVNCRVKRIVYPLTGSRCGTTLRTTTSYLSAHFHEFGSSAKCRARRLRGYSASSKGVGRCLDPLETSSMRFVSVVLHRPRRQRPRLSICLLTCTAVAQIQLARASIPTAFMFSYPRPFPAPQWFSSLGARIQSTLTFPPPKKWSAIRNAGYGMPADYPAA